MTSQNSEVLQSIVATFPAFEPPTRKRQRIACSTAPNFRSRLRAFRGSAPLRRSRDQACADLASGVSEPSEARPHCGASAAPGADTVVETVVSEPSEARPHCGDGQGSAAGDAVQSPSLPRLGPIAALETQREQYGRSRSSPSLPRLGPIAAACMGCARRRTHRRSPSLPRLGPIAALYGFIRDIFLLIFGLRAFRGSAPLRR